MTAFIGNKLSFNIEAENDRSDEETYLKIGFELLIHDKPAESLEWFEKANPYNDETIAGKAYAAFSLQSWQEVIDAYRHLSPLFLSIDAYHGFAIEALTELGEIGEAEKILQNLMNLPPEAPDTDFTPYFRAFNKAKLDQWNRYFIAALFSKMIKKDNEEALAYFQQIKQPTPLMSLEKAEVMIDLGMVEEAKLTILNSQRQIAESGDKLKIKPRLLPLLAEAYAKVNFFAEASACYKEYFDSFSLKGKDSIYRLDYAHVLMKIRRYDLAFVEYVIHFHNESPAPGDAVAFLSCLVHTGQFSHANQLAFDWEKYGSLPLLPRLQIARLMVITQNQQIIETVLEDVEKNSSRSLEENSELLRLWVELGNYDDATVLVEELGGKLEQIPSGLLALAIYNEKLSHFNKALAYARKAAEMDPYYIEAAKFLERYERSQDSIQQGIKQQETELRSEPDSITIKLLYTKDLLDLFTVQFATQNIDPAQSTELQAAKKLLESVQNKTKEIPETFLLLGKLMFFLNDDIAAKKAYFSAVYLDVSYVESYQNLSVLYEEENDLKQAEAAIENGIKFRPYDADLRQQLGGLRFKLGNFRGAISALAQATKYAPNNPSPLIDLAKVYIATQQFDDAMQLLDNAKLLSKDKTEIFILKLEVISSVIKQRSV